MEKNIWPLAHYVNDCEITNRNYTGLALPDRNMNINYMIDKPQVKCV